MYKLVLRLNTFEHGYLISTHVCGDQLLYFLFTFSLYFIYSNISLRQMPTAPTLIPAHARGSSLEQVPEDVDHPPPGAPAFDLK